MKRRFNVVVLPLPDDMNEEISIVTKRVSEMAETLQMAAPKNVDEEVRRVVSIFRELRGGETLDGKVTLKKPTGNLSTAEAIAVMVGGLSQATYFNQGKLSAEGISPTLI
ncbi:MAG: ATPase, partial [Pseudomonadota bacterium]